jgi:hypothetical protein
MATCRLDGSKHSELSRCRWYSIVDMESCAGTPRRRQRLNSNSAYLQVAKPNLSLNARLTRYAEKPELSHWQFKVLGCKSAREIDI